MRKVDIGSRVAKATGLRKAGMSFKDIAIEVGRAYSPGVPISVSRARSLIKMGENWKRERSYLKPET